MACRALANKFRDFETMAPPYDESFPIELKPSDLALKHAVGKARASALRPNAYILAARPALNSKANVSKT